MSPAGARRPPPSRVLWTALRRARRRGGPRTTTLLRALPRMVPATLSGQYKGLSRSRLGLVTLAAAYVASPVDLLPEALLGPLGLTDDAAVLAWLAGTVLTEAEAFLAWERAGRPATGVAPPGSTGAPSWASGPTGATGSGRAEDPRAGWPGFSRPGTGYGGTGPGATAPGGRSGRTRSDREGPDDPDVIIGEVVR